MKITEQDIEIIKLAFERMQTRHDFLHLLNFAKKLIYGNNTIPFELKQLTYYINPNIGNPRYSTFEINKKSGAKRTINAPVKGLKAIQKSLSLVLRCVYNPHPAAMGFVTNKSIVNNAQMHISCNYVFNADLKDFFTSIDQARVWKVLQLPPFNLSTSDSSQIDYFEWDEFVSKFHKVENPNMFLKGKGRLFIKTDLGTLFVSKNFNPHKEKFVIRVGESKGIQGNKSLEGSLWLVNSVPKANRLGIANMIASLCCTEMTVERMNSQGEMELILKNVLPQGAPTSPILTNIVCQRLDFLLTGVAKRFGLNYSRYADDITFSSQHNVYQEDSEFQREFRRVVESQNFLFNSKKTRLQKRGYRQEVTGLTVNDKVSTSKTYVKQLRMWLYYWERYGYDKASSYFIPNYLSERDNSKKGLPEMMRVVSGKLDFLKMVKGVESPSYRNLKFRFDKLIGKDPEVNSHIVDEPPAVDVELIKMLSGLFEKTIAQSNEKSTDDISSVTNDGQQLPIFHKAKDLERLLSKFTENNHPLKYSSHSWGDGKIEGIFEDYFDFLKIFDEVGKPICFEIQRLKKSLGTKILHFLNTSNENGKYFIGDRQHEYYWGEYRMRYGWKSKEISGLAKQNPEKDPFDFTLPNKTVINRGNRDLEISTFGDIVGLFKSEIEIRPENSDLYNLFVELRRKHLGRDFKVDVGTTLKGKQFYTDVHDFKRALNRIFREIKIRTMHPNVSIWAGNQSDTGCTIIEILHLDSFCDEKTSEEMMHEINNGDFSEILKCLHNLCDWSVESIFSDGIFRINYLSSNEMDTGAVRLDKAEGFKHVFKFYKS